ncbi:MAG: hypothetical protein DI626_03955 [Micavibrio aeruginosavorus]|uniref:Uncharacterized protein n=1 Tax=Micavibrio aeruginosavorus TaxID=349221 RepID=A0A2W5BWF1_9BACT|nr:MAG: hypothetical protein DI626_03955 [Micavibrio aeruginosavorus]
MRMSSKNVQTTGGKKDAFHASNELKILWSACAAIIAAGVITEVKNAAGPRGIEITDNSRAAVTEPLVPLQLTQ